MALYLIQNGAAGLTAAPVAVTTGTAVKTMLQFKALATAVAKVVEWGISFDGSTAATPGKVELFEKARIAGDVYYNLLEMAVGAEVNGKLVRQKPTPAPVNVVPALSSPEVE